MASIGELYAPEGNITTFVVNAVTAYSGLVVDRPAYTHYVDNKLEPFLKDFPHGKVPAFKGKNGIAIFEGAAIARYFAALAKEAGMLPESLEEQAQVDQWCHFVDSEMVTNGYLHVVVCHERIGPYIKEYSDVFKSREERAYNTINNHLEGRQYLVGDKITLADVTLAATIRVSIGYTFAKAEREKYPNILGHFERLAKVPSLEKVLGGATYAEEPVKHSPKA